MYNLKYAFRFIWASFSLAFKKSQLQEQWVYIAVGNLILLIIWFLPLALTVGLIGLWPIGMVLVGFISILMLYSFYVWGEITREHACQMLANINQLDAESEEGEQQPPNLLGHWPDILIWTMVKPVMRIRSKFSQFFWPDQEEKHPWLESQALMIPLISLEDLSLKEAVSRINEMINAHLLRFKPGFLKINLIVKTILWVVCIIGILTGISVALIVADPLTMNPWQGILALGIGLLIAWVFITLGHLFSTFVRSCYHTSLYQWVMNVKAARELGNPEKAVPPEILRQALGHSEMIKNYKER